MGTGAEEVVPLVTEFFGGEAAAGAVGGELAGGAAAGALMPAAVPETAAALSGYGLTETAPGVFTPATAGIGAGVLQTIKDAATILSPVASIAASASGIAAAKRAGALSTMPRVAPSTPVPSFGSPIVSQAQQASFTEQLRRRGRAATILTSPSEGEKLGG